MPKDHPQIPRICELIKGVYSVLHDKELMQPAKKKEVRRETAKTRSSAKPPPTGVKTASITESVPNSLTASVQTAANNPAASKETPKKKRGEYSEQLRVDESNVITEHHPESTGGSLENTSTNRPIEDDELVRKMNGIDATLVKMMRKIEMQA